MGEVRWICEEPGQQVGVVGADHLDEAQTKYKGKGKPKLSRQDLRVYFFKRLGKLSKARGIGR